MKKTLIPLLIAMFSMTANAQEWGRDRDRDDRGFERRPREGRYYDDVFGPARTVRWANAGTYKIPKIVEQEIVINARGQFINELLLRADRNGVEITRADAYLTNGERVSIRRAIGTFRGSAQVRARLDRRSSLAVDRIVIKATSKALIGSRGQLTVDLGLAY